MTTATAEDLGDLRRPGEETALRPHAEQEYAAELAALAAADDRARPPGGRLSPWAVTTYLLGGMAADGTEITPKYVGSRRLIEVAVATLATDRALLLLGVTGTAKTWLSEHLAAAISADSTLMVQGTAGTAEEAVRYGWNYARLIAEGPSPAAMVPSPVMRAMAGGQIARGVGESGQGLSTRSPRQRGGTGGEASCPARCAGVPPPGSCRSPPRPSRRWT